ncbi:hypothetical protein BU14_0082s0047 [Porphyra umbilicalis]|uniref:Uncharacterized protein n=1 Tax=Porphyra umbilicalis TaxID=2786 RepID=A0A1X6PEJ8_PORUM|nr:hypothetical protein BU14_0082s0047 [Porphyra umbilicalis]|eukprot:OSX79282.1 hypothetical protein BU14_0082s0047 [Porphyra umbilicalis]
MAEATVEAEAPPPGAVAVKLPPTPAPDAAAGGVPNPKGGAGAPLLLAGGRGGDGGGGGVDNALSPVAVVVPAPGRGDAVLVLEGGDGGATNGVPKGATPTATPKGSRRSTSVGAGGGNTANGGGSGTGAAEVSVLVSTPSADGSTAPTTAAAASSASSGVDPTAVRDDILYTLCWVAAAGVVAAGVAATLGAERGLEFVAAYVVEYSLSVDNLLVFLLLFQHFHVPRRLQARVLKWGIIGAMSLRGVMIVAGEALTRRFRWVSLVFGGILLVSAAKMLIPGAGGDDEDVANNATVRFARRLLPFSDAYDGDRFFTSGAGGPGGDGPRLATPLMLVLLSVEFSDVVFALDSVPAVLGISSHTFVIYASNIMAVLGLRSLFFVISEAIGDLRFLQPALAVVLAFVGLKMMAGVAGYEVGILPSLGVITVCVGGGVAASLLFPEGEKDGEEDKKA